MQTWTRLGHRMIILYSSKMNKKQLSERDICSKFITPSLVKNGWDMDTQIREEFPFTSGQVIVRGKKIFRGKRKRVDYLLSIKQDFPIALIEVKENNHNVGDGMQQALDYAESLRCLTYQCRQCPQNG